MITSNIFIPIVLLLLGVVLGYVIRHYLFTLRSDSVEAKLKLKIQEAKEESKEIILKAKEEAAKIVEEARKEEKEKKDKLDQLEIRLIKREEFLDHKHLEVDNERQKLAEDINKAKQIKEDLLKAKELQEQKLQEISNLTREEARNLLIKQIEDEHKNELAAVMQKLEGERQETIRKKAEEIVSSAIQRFSHGNASEIMISTVSLPSEDMKGRIIGKEGRNIHHFEKVSGVELIIDDSPDIITLSSFNPIRREIARLALEKLIQDGRIQPAKIEEKIA